MEQLRLLWPTDTTKTVINRADVSVRGRAWLRVSFFFICEGIKRGYVWNTFVSQKFSSIFHVIISITTHDMTMNKQRTRRSIRLVYLAAMNDIYDIYYP
jgi:hypothetical protein